MNDDDDDDGFGKGSFVGEENRDEATVVDMLEDDETIGAVGCC